MYELKTPWHVIEDSQGYLNVHEAGQDAEGDTGDIIATVYQDENIALLIAAAPMVLKALMEAVDAMRAYLPPDGIDKAEFIDRVIGALDNPDINPIIALADEWAKGETQ